MCISRCYTLKMPSEKRKIGDICEDVCVKHLLKHGLGVIQRNYLKKWGEIDIIAKDVSCESLLLHFIEVKGSVSYESYISGLPEENVHYWKQKRIWRAIQTWIMEHKEYDEVEWQVDVMAVFLDLERKKARIRWTKNVILDV